jgi:hypothetical protein
VFSKPSIEQQFDKFVVVRLNTWGNFPGQVPDPDGALAFRDQKFKNYALPFYVVVRVKGKTLTRIGTVEQPVLTEPEFAQFLQATLKVPR